MPGGWTCRNGECAAVNWWSDWQCYQCGKEFEVPNRVPAKGKGKGKGKASRGGKADGHARDDVANNAASAGSNETSSPKPMTSYEAKLAARAAVASLKAESVTDHDMQSDTLHSDISAACRCPVVCILGSTLGRQLLHHVSSGFERQIGATFLSAVAVRDRIRQSEVGLDSETEPFGMLVVDSHEKSLHHLYDFAILVININGLQTQVIHDLMWLRDFKIPFVVAWGDMDSIFEWNLRAKTQLPSRGRRRAHPTKTRPSMDAHSGCGMEKVLGSQTDSVKQKFDGLWQNLASQLRSLGVRCALYWENNNSESTVSVVPVSTRSGEGISDLICNVATVWQHHRAPQSRDQDAFRCGVLKVNHVKGYGITADVLLVNGALKQGDQVALSGVNGTIVTTVKALLMPQSMENMSNSCAFTPIRHVDRATCVKICASGLEGALVGCNAKIVSSDGGIESVQQAMQAEVDGVLKKFCDSEQNGVCVKANDFNSIRKLSMSLKDMQIPVREAGLGAVRHEDVHRAAIMHERGSAEHAIILCFDEEVSASVQGEANQRGVHIISSFDVDYILGKFSAHLAHIVAAGKHCTRVVTCHVGLPGEGHTQHVQCLSMAGALICELDVSLDEPFGPQVVYVIRKSLGVADDLTLVSSDGVHLWVDAGTSSAVFPAILSIRDQMIVSRANPFSFDACVERGQLRVGTPLVVPGPGGSFLDIGCVAGIKQRGAAKKECRWDGGFVTITIVPAESQDHICDGQHFDSTTTLYSKISEESIGALRRHCREQMREKDWERMREDVIVLKGIFGIRSPT